jgi:hypothetical protein
VRFEIATPDKERKIMSKKNDESPATDSAPPKPAQPRYRVRTPVGNYRGTRFGVNVFDGVGETNEPQAVMRCIDCGYEVEDRQLGFVANPLPDRRDAEDNAEAMLHDLTREIAATAKEAKAKKAFVRPVRTVPAPL